MLPLLDQFLEGLKGFLPLQKAVQLPYLLIYRSFELITSQPSGAEMVFQNPAQSFYLDRVCKYSVEYYLVLILYGDETYYFFRNIFHQIYTPHKGIMI